MVDSAPALLHAEPGLPDPIHAAVFIILFFAFCAWAVNGGIPRWK